MDFHDIKELIQELLRMAGVIDKTGTKYTKLLCYLLEMAALKLSEKPAKLKNNPRMHVAQKCAAVLR